jgi:hypothetical protein
VDEHATLIRLVHQSNKLVRHHDFVFNDVMINVLATGPKACGFKPGHEQWIFKDDKNP